MALEDLYTLSGAGLVTVPLNTATVTSVGEIIAGKKYIPGTDLNVDIQAGDWIVDLVNQEARRVTYVSAQGEKLSLGGSFSNSTASAALNVVKADAASVVYMELTASGSILVDAAEIADGIITFGQPNESGSPSLFVRPRFVNPQSGSCLVNLTYFDNQTAL